MSNSLSHQEAGLWAGILAGGTSAGTGQLLLQRHLNKSKTPILTDTQLKDQFSVLKKHINPSGKSKLVIGPIANKTGPHAGANYLDEKVRTDFFGNPNKQQIKNLKKKLFSKKHIKDKGTYVAMPTNASEFKTLRRAETIAHELGHTKQLESTP